MANELIVRDIARADHEQWLMLWQGYNDFYKRVGPAAIPDDVTHTTWSRFFDSYDPVHALVAESNGRLVGLAHYIYHRNTTMLGPVCYLQDLFTSPEARGKGVGRALIEGVYDQARRAGSPRVYWQTHETNLAAQALYDKVAERSGFIVYRRTI